MGTNSVIPIPPPIGEFSSSPPLPVAPDENAVARRLVPEAIAGPVGGGGTRSPAIPPPPPGFNFTSPPVEKTAPGIPAPPPGFDLTAPPTVQDHLARVAGKAFGLPSETPTGVLGAPAAPAAMVIPGIPKPPLPEELKSDTQRTAETPTFQNPRTGRITHQTPMGQSVLDFPYNAAVHATEGTEALAHPAEAFSQHGVYAPATYPNIGKDIARGAGKLAQAGFEAATPLAVASGVAAPLEAAATLGAGIAAQKLTQAGLQHLGVAPEYADLAGDIAAIVAGYGVHLHMAPPEVQSLVQAAQTPGPDADPIVNAKRIDDLTRMATHPATPPNEAAVAREMLRMKYGIHIPDPVVNPDIVPPQPPQEAAPEPPPPPVANVSEFTRAHNAWNVATIKAATSFMQDNPGVSFDEAKQAVDGTVGREPQIEDYKAPPPPPQPPTPPAEAAPPPEPPKPSKVQKVSPATPNPPTAAIPTTPESPETIALQVQQLGRVGEPATPNQRKAVMFPQGQGMPPLESLGGLQIAHDKFGNVYAFRPDLIDRGQISSAASNNKLPEILGGPLGMGAPDKTALQGAPIAVKATDANGVEAQTTVTDAQNLPQTIASTHAVTPPGGTVSVVPPEEALAGRNGTIAPAEASHRLASWVQYSGMNANETLDGFTPAQWDVIGEHLDIPITPEIVALARTRLSSLNWHADPKSTIPPTTPDFAQKFVAAKNIAKQPEGGGPNLPAGQVESPQAQPPVTTAPVPPGVPPPPPGFDLEEPPINENTYRQAVDLVRSNPGGTASTAVLQRSLRLGYGAASRILDRMQTEGIVGAPNKTGRREVLPPQITKPYNANPADLGTAQPAATDGNPPSVAPGAIPQGNGPLPVREPGGIRGAEVGAPPVEPVGGSAGVGTRGTGETAAGKPEAGVRRITGSADIPLTPAGRAQAADLAKKAVVPFNIVVHSPSQRSTETAAAFLGPKMVRQSLNGWGRGASEGQPVDAVKDLMSQLILNPDQVPAGVSPISGLPGQSWNQMSKPMFKDVFGILRSAMPKERILIITSGGNLQAIDEWGKASYPASGEFDHTAMAAKPYWSVTGKLFKLDSDGLTEVADNRAPGIYLAEHGSTNFNAPGEKGTAKVVTPQVPTGVAGATSLGVPSSRGTEPTTTEPAVQRPRQEDIRPLESESAEVRPESSATGTSATGSGGGGGTTRPGVQPVPTGGISGGPGGRSGTRTVEPSTEPAGGRVTGDLTRQTEGGDFRISPSDHIGEGTPRQKLSDNLEAIRTIRKIEKEGRPATAEEQEKIAKYAGWGGLSQIFDWNKRDWAGAREELTSLLTPEEYKAASASTKNAHFTSPEVITSMWDAMQQFGVKPGLRILEPSMGIGSFFGLQPDALMPAKRTGVELDKITGAMAKALYPDSNVQITGFEKMALPNDFFDVAISNVPFGNYPVYDPQYKRNRTAVQSIHNYFFVKSLDLVRPGGIVGFVTSRYTMDAQDPALRELLASKANLVGMMRLPNTAFKGNAGTQVVTDVIFLQKRPDGEAPSGPQFTDAVPMQTSDGQTAIVNQYYADHPEMLLGKLSMEGTQYGPNQQTLEGKLTPEMLREAVDRLPQNIYSEWKAETPAFEGNQDFVQLGDEVKDGGYAVKDGVIVQREGSIYKPAVVNAKQADRIRSMIPVRSALRRVFETQLSDAPEKDILAARDALNRSYDAFARVHGALSNPANARALGDDPDYIPLSGALEDYDRETKEAKKTDIFAKRTVERPRLPNHADTANEALAMVLNERGRLDWNRMQELTGKTPDELREDLGGQVFQNPDGQKWETQDEYLSGNVRKKLEIAEKAAKIDPAFRRNVEALTQVQPTDLRPDEIKITPGAPWIPADTVQQFVRQVMGLDAAKVHFSPIAATWSIDVPKHQRERVSNSETYGTENFYGHELFDMALNGKSPRVYRDGPNDTRIFDPKATAVSQAAMDSLKDKFREWIWDEPKRSEMLSAKYNKEVNNLRHVDHDGSFLTLPGSNPLITLRPHQKNGIWRGLKTGNVLYAHEVGAGKTWTMVGLAMEARRLGLAKKPMIVVPNHMAEQFSKEFLQLYPAARILTIGKEDFAKQNRTRAVARIAGGNWDAVIIRHSSFEKIPVSDETYQAFVDNQVEELKSALEDQKKETGSNDKKKDKTVKEIEKAISRLEVKLQKHLSREDKDTGVTFEQLGTDLMMVDEAHAFKALPIVTRRTRVAGIPTRESDRATDMYMKTQYVSKLNGGGRGVVFATGTPVTNTMAELYNMQRYLQGHALRDAGIEHFDSWANMFGDVRTGVEIDVSGKGFRENTRFAKFINIPELMKMYMQVADVKTAEMMKLPRPDLETGGPIAVSAPATPELNAYVDHLIDRAEAIRGGQVDKRKDNMLKVVSEGKKAALDMRLVDPSASDRPTSKVNKAVSNIYRIWKSTDGSRATQIVFCDLSVPLSAKSKKKKNRASVPEDVDAEDDLTAVPEAAGELAGFSVYDDMRRKLINAGVPSKEIAFIHDYDSDEKKQELFDSVNAGRVRILFGSTEKMGVGTNVQKRAIALHHMDAPWRPADIKQRDGRIQRQGNMHKSVQIYQYLTEGSFDAYSWQLLENKAAFIAPIQAGDTTIREMEDVGMMLPSAAEFKAMASGNPLIKEKIGTDSELAKLDAQRSAFRRQQSGIKHDLARLPEKISDLKRNMARAQKDVDTVAAHKDSGFTVGSQHFTGDDARKDAAVALHTVLESWRGPHAPQKVGTYDGLEIWTVPGQLPESYPGVALHGTLTYTANSNPENPSGTLTSIAATVRNNVGVPRWMPKELEESETKLKQLEPLLDRTWPHEKRYADLAKRKAEIDAVLDQSEAEKAASAEDRDVSTEQIQKGTPYQVRKQILLARERGENVDYASATAAARSEAITPKPSAEKPVDLGKNAGPDLIPAKIKEALKSGKFGSERGSFTVPPSLEKFYESDLKPAAKWVSQRVTGGLDDLKKVFAPQTRGPAARRGAGIVRERGAEMDQRRDRAFALLKDFKNHFYKDTPEIGGFYGLDVWNAIETGRTMGLSPTDRAFALAARSLLDPRKDELLKLDILKNYVENYLPREWKDESAATNWVQSWQSKRPMAGTEAFRRQRTYPTMKEGIEDPDFHLVPKFDNPVDMLMSKIGQMDQSITAHRAFEEMHEKGDLKYVQFGKKPPVGWQKIDDKLFTVYGPKFGAVELPDSQVHSVLPEEDMEEGVVRPEDVRVHGQRIMGHYYAPEPLAQVINNHLSQGINNTPALEIWQGANNLMNMVELTASYYHGLTTTLNSSLSDMALGIEQALNGRPVEAAKAIGRGIVPFASVIQDVMKGTRIQKAWDMQPDELKNLMITDPVTWAIVDTLKAAGGKARQDQFYMTGFLSGLKDAWEKGNPIGAAWRAPFAALELAMKPIMEYMVPRVKLGAFAKLAVEELQHHPTMTRDQMRAQFGQIWNSVDNRFGQLAQRNLLMHALARGAMNAVIGRPGWNVGSAQEILGGVGDAAKNLNDAIHGRAPRISHKTAYVLALLFGGALINGMTSWLLSKKPPEGMDFLAPQDGGVTEDGRPSRIILPTYLGKDIYSYATKPWMTLKAKAAPVLSLTADLLENRDFQRQKIYLDRSIGIWQYLKNEVTPYSVAGLEKNNERGASFGKKILPFVGIMPAGKRVGLSKAEQMITEYQDEQRAQTRAPSTQRNKAETKVFLDARRGDQKKAQQDGQKSVASGLMSPADVRHSIDRAKQTPLVADYKRVTDFRTAMEIYDVATPEERKTIYREARNKAFLAQSKPWLWQNPDGTPDKQLRTVVQANFGMKPYQPRAYAPSPSQFSTPPPIGVR